MRSIKCVSLGVLVIIGIVGTGCASAGSFVEESDDAPRTVSRALVTLRGGVILPPEIRAASSSTVYEAVFRLRPGFFNANRSMGSSRASVRPSAILGGGFPEPLEVLRLVSVDDVAEIRFMEPSDAMLRFGSAYSAGVIIVRLRGTRAQPFG